MPVDRNGLEILSRPECLRLLDGPTVGRVAISRYALPAILPVTYSLLGEDIVFATGTGSKSLAVAHDNVIAFEVDDVDPTARLGWSVLAVGMARRLDERDADWEAALDLHLRPWAGHHAVYLIRLPTQRLSGRRLIASQRHEVDSATR